VKQYAWLVLLLFALVPGPGGRAQNLPDLGERAQSDLSPQQERKIGEQIMREIRRDPDYVDDPEVSAYVQSVGQRLVAASPDARQEFTFFVVRDKTINAFALPGGFIGVHSGLIVGSQTESEFAGVVSHEIAHVIQRHLARQLQAANQLSPLALVGLGLAILAARSSPELAQGAAIASQAAPVAAMLNFSREFEREADRVGFQILQDGGYEPAGMSSFFTRLQQNTRLYDNNAPAYLRTHPLTVERIADMQNRAQDAQYKQRPDSIEFQLVRAKLGAGAGRPEDAVANFRTLLAERRFATEAATRYGYAVALLRAKDQVGAEREMAALRKTGPTHPMIETLATRIRVAAGDRAGAEKIIAAAARVYPDNVGVLYEYAEVLQSVGNQARALDVLREILKQRPQDARAYNLIAKSYASLGKRTEQHRALAEGYYLQGGIAAAVDQLALAQKAGDGDFYTLSAIDARLRELRKLQQDEIRERKK
jgi:predicted Zn-dependent protease